MNTKDLKTLRELTGKDPVHFQCTFLPEVKKFKVEFLTADVRYVELMTIARYLRFAKSDEKPLKIGGMEIICNPPEREKQFRDYFKEVAASYMAWKKYKK